MIDVQRYVLVQGKLEPYSGHAGIHAGYETLVTGDAYDALARQLEAYEDGAEYVKLNDLLDQKERQLADLHGEMGNVEQHYQRRCVELKWRLTEVVAKAQRVVDDCVGTSDAVESLKAALEAAKEHHVRDAK